MTIQAIGRDELRLLIEEKGKIRLFEVLPKMQWEAGHIPGAAVMPLEKIAETAARLAPNKADDVVVYCASQACKNSHIAASKLAELGYQSVRVFEGGKAEWKDAGLSLEVAQ